MMEVIVPTWDERVLRIHHSPRDYLDAARATDADAELLGGLATLPYPFIREAVAEHPNTRPETLLALIPPELHSWHDRALLRKIVSHPAADAGVLAQARDRVYAALEAEDRPYSIAIALAHNGGLISDDVDAFGRLPGASARLRHGLRRALERQPANPDTSNRIATTEATPTEGHD